MAFANSTSVNSASSAAQKTIHPDVMAKMTLNIPSRTGKKLSILVDAFRILAWESFRSEYKEELKDLAYGGYGVFEELWKQQEIHNLSYEEVIAYAKGLEFTEPQLVNLRNNYYAKKAKTNTGGNGNRGNGNDNGNGNVHSNGNGNGGNYEETTYNSQEFDAEALF
jgi:hypothetical protein